MTGNSGLFKNTYGDKMDKKCEKCLYYVDGANECYCNRFPDECFFVEKIETAGKPRYVRMTEQEFIKYHNRVYDKGRNDGKSLNASLNEETVKSIYTDIANARNKLTVLVSLIEGNNRILETKNKQISNNLLINSSPLSQFVANLKIKENENQIALNNEYLEKISRIFKYL